MEEIIKEQIRSLQKQREEMTSELRRIDFNGLNDFTRKTEIGTQINFIDNRIDTLLDRLPKS